MCRASFVTLLVLGTPNTPSLAQSYSDTERVTVIDLPVELRSRSRPEAPAQKPPADLTARDFEILLDGRSQELVAVDSVSAVGTDPLHLLIYVDAALSDGRELEESLDLVASMAGQISGAATVDLVVADPDPRFLLQRSTEPDVLENLLASPNWGDSASDDLRALRAGFLEALSDTETEIDLHTLQTAFALEEARLVQQRLDLLLSFVADRTAAGRQKVLVLAGLQFDLDPMSFYSTWSDDASGPLPEARRESRTIGDSTQALAATLAGLGWLTYPIAPPPRESPLRPGLRVGKWRVAGPAGGRIIGLRMTREAERDPELARGYLENGQALLEQGSAVEAEKAFRLALHHFSGDRRTAEEQAQAAAGLAEALEAQGSSVQARSTLRIASDLDTAVASDHPEALAVLLEPTESLEVLALESSGRVIFEQQELQDTLDGLANRLRLSFQMPGDPTGDLYPVEVRYLRKGLLAKAPAWVRFGSPPNVAAARVRLLHDDAGIAAPAILDARAERSTEEPGMTRLEFILPPIDDGEQGRRDQERSCRLTMTVLAEDTPIEVEQQQTACRPTAGGLEGSARLSVPEEEDLLGILVEDLATGNWGADIFEIASP
jgi:tetratricopeptide (TPR) repeat protein